MANYGRFDLIRYGGELVITDMQTHMWVSERIGDGDKAHQRARELRDLFEQVPEIAEPALIDVLARCAGIKQGKLRTAVRTIIHAAAENANEYVHGKDFDMDAHDLGWSTAYLMTIENKCEGASAAVRDWLNANAGVAIAPASTEDEGDGTRRASPAPSASENNNAGDDHAEAR